MTSSITPLQRLVGVVVCYGALLCIAADAWVYGVLALLVGGGLLLAAGRVGDDQGQALGPTVLTMKGLPLAVVVLVLWPVISLLIVLPSSVVAGNSLAETPLELVVPVLALAVIGGGFLAAARDADSSTHGWWALGAGFVSVVLFAGVIAV